MVTIGNQRTKEDNFLLVKNMKHDLLNVSQISDQGHTLTFYFKKYRIKDKYIGSLVTTATKTPNNVYILDEKEERCFLGQVYEWCLWNRRMRHINFDNLEIIIKIQAVQDIPKITNPLQLVYIHFQHGK